MICIQKRPEKKDFIKYKQDVSPSRASSAKQRTEWAPHSVLCFAEEAREGETCCLYLIKSFSPVFLEANDDIIQQKRLTSHDDQKRQLSPYFVFV